MKPQITPKFLLVCLCLIITSSYAQIGIGTTTPDASSMLDIQSDAKGVLIPRMTSAQRLLVKDPVTGKPANGLLVFDTDKKSFWFYNGTATIPAWKELVSGSSIVDADGDTRVEVEKTADLDEINFTANGTEYMQIVGANGDIKLGNRANSTDTSGEQNYTKITADGSLSYVGNATRWDDLKVPVNAVKIGGGKKDAVDFVPAEWDAFLTTSLALLWFSDESDADEQDVVFTVQLPHAWKEGSTIKPHVHWTVGRIDDKTGVLKDSDPSGKTVYWSMEYSWVSPGDTFMASTPTYGIANGTTISVGTIGVNNHVITGLTPIIGKKANGTNQTLSSMLVCRLWRDSSADSYTGSAGLLEIDFHIQIDSDGSNEEYIKTN